MKGRGFYIVAVFSFIPLFSLSKLSTADTVKTFDDTTGTDYSTGNCVPTNPEAQPPVILAEDSTSDGSFLRLVAADAPILPLNNTITFDRTDPGLFSRVIAEFDFRITPDSGRADGFGFALLNTAFYGAGDSVCTTLAPFASEEPSFEGSIGFGFDIFQSTGVPDYPDDVSNNHISIHFDGNLVEQFDLTPAIDLANKEWIHARIELDMNDGFSSVSVFLTPLGGEEITAIDGFSVPGMTPYEGRAFFGARAGGLAAHHDLDNINIQFLDPLAPEFYGQWSDTFNVEIVGVHMSLLPTGKVLSWQNGGYEQPFVGQILLWDPASETLTTPALPEFDIFCVGHSFLADGGLFMTGGHDQADGVGLSDATIYDPFTDSWNAVADMNDGRWYPTNTTLSSGDVLVISGSVDTFFVKNLLPQVWQSSDSVWRDLTNAQQEKPQSGDLYPRMFLAPNGRVFRADPDIDGYTWFLDTSGSGQWMPGPPSNFGKIRDYGSAVMYDAGKILVVGGGNPPTATAEIIDLNEAYPTWQAADTMTYARRHLNAALLPDGKVLVIGGTSSPGFNEATDAVLVAEMWDPDTDRWTIMAPLKGPRVYHSTAILLPDGRVLAGGGGRPAPGPEGEHEDRKNFILYSPPYLFQSAQPIIDAAPETVTYCDTFVVETPDAASIKNVNWIRLPSVTHAFDQNQRFNRLSFFQTGDSLNIVAPINPNLAPPGHYMLFILNASGVPSIARIVQITGLISPGLISPTDKTKSVTNDTTVVWRKVSGADSYHFQLSGIPSFKNTVLDISGIEDTSYTISKDAFHNYSTYYWRMKAVSSLTRSGWSKTWSFYTDIIVSLRDLGRNIPKQFRLAQNYPNPFNPSTTIEFDLPKTEFVTLALYNIFGAKVMELVHENLEAGSYSIQVQNDHLASGIYIYKLQTETFSQAKKMILAK